MTICVVSCSSLGLPHCGNIFFDLSQAMGEIASVRTLILSETKHKWSGDVETIEVPEGTKLSKIRHIAKKIDTDLFCICDPDMVVVKEGCLNVLNHAIEEMKSGKETIVFGIVEGKTDGSLLSRMIAIDKWLSHRVLRPLLWSLGIGLTLPGQFLIVSSSLLSSLDPIVDTYLDDLYLGLVARYRHVSVIRVTTVVGTEVSRSSWLSLLTQRLRWMKGIVSLSCHFFCSPVAIALIGIHFFTYHGIALIWLALILLLVYVHFLTAVSAVLCLAIVFAKFSGMPIRDCVSYLLVFPFIHVVAMIAWWVPIDRSILMRR